MQELMMEVYPLGLTGAPHQQDHVKVERLLKILDWIPHWQKLGVTTVYFAPLFSSGTHGYDTHDYRQIDPRLGDNETFQRVVAALHEAGIKVIIDAVFNHVGRGFPAFQELLAQREQARHKDWFYVDFHGNNQHNDGLYYEAWEGHEELVKLNLQNPEVVQYHLDTVKFWIDYFDIDGLRLDVAYLLDESFLQRLRHETEQMKDNFFLVGEMIHGDYRRIVAEDKLHSATNYELYKGLYSSLNDRNLFEIAHSLQRQFGPEEWALYPELTLLTFADNHDVSRLASILKDSELLPVAYGILLTMPGIPCLYYGSEWGILGNKAEGDWALRPQLDAPQWNELTSTIQVLASWRAHSKAICLGDFQNIEIRNTYWLFKRSSDKDTVYIGVNLEDQVESLPLHDEVKGQIFDMDEPITASAEGAMEQGSPFQGNELKIPAKFVRLLQVKS